MTVRRVPGSLGEAIMRACRPLGGPANAGLALGLNESQLAHYSNPNKKDRIPLDVAAALDRECLAADGSTPLCDWMRGQMASVEPGTDTPMQHFADCTMSFAELQSAFAAAMADNRIDAEERRQLYESIIDMQRQLTMWKRALKPQGGAS